MVSDAHMFGCSPTGCDDILNALCTCILRRLAQTYRKALMVCKNPGASHLGAHVESLLMCTHRWFHEVAYRYRIFVNQG